MRFIRLALVVACLFVVSPAFALNDTEGERFYFDECGELIGEDYWMCGFSGTDHYGSYSSIYREFIMQRCDLQPFSCADAGLVDLCGWCVTEGYYLSAILGHVEDPCSASKTE